MKKLLIIGVIALSAMTRAEAKLGEYRMWQDIEVRAEQKEKEQLARDRAGMKQVEIKDDGERGHDNKGSGGAY